MPVSHFVFRPYNYDRPVVHHGWFDNRTRVLRIGERFHIGDSYLGTGLGPGSCNVSDVILELKDEWESERFLEFLSMVSLLLFILVMAWKRKNDLNVGLL